jgi:hypothetical protein
MVYEVWPLFIVPGVKKSLQRQAAAISVQAAATHTLSSMAFQVSFRAMYLKAALMPASSIFFSGWSKSTFGTSAEEK